MVQSPFRWTPQFSIGEFHHLRPKSPCFPPFFSTSVGSAAAGSGWKRRSIACSSVAGARCSASSCREQRKGRSSCLRSEPFCAFRRYRYPWCLVGYCLSQGADFCTWTSAIQRADIRVQKFACGLRNQPYYYILPWFFPQWIRGPSFWDLGKKKCRSFGSGDTKSIATANPSHNNTLFYILSKYSIKKSISELRSNWWSFVLTGTSTSRRVNGWRG